MNGILQDIVNFKKRELVHLKDLRPRNSLLKDPGISRKTISMRETIISGSGLIAEFKRASPSKGIIRPDTSVEEITKGYQNAGASAVSVLTDTNFFKADPNDIIYARKTIKIPILRKEFIIDEYQVFQSKILGADCILLIAAILKKDELKNLLYIASELDLEVIVEVHNEEDLSKLSGKETIIGVNNRNLDTFEVDIKNSLSLASQLGEVVRISESGLGTKSNLNELISAGYHGFLVGESFMKHPDPGLAAEEFINYLNAFKS